MTAAAQTAESILRAEHSLGFAVSDLTAAVGTASPVAEIAARQLLKAAVELQTRANGLRAALETEAENAD